MVYQHYGELKNTQKRILDIFDVYDYGIYQKDDDQEKLSQCFEIDSRGEKKHI